MKSSYQLARHTSRSVYAWVYGRLYVSGWQRLVNDRPIAAHLASLDQSQWFDAERIERLQVAKLRALLGHAGTHVPYYRELFARIGFDPRDLRSRADLAQLPVLTKDIVRERRDALVDPTRRRRAVEKDTSGTTGAPLRFQYCNDSEGWRQAVRLRGYGWAGYRPGLPTLLYWGGGHAQVHGVWEGAKVALDRALRRELYVDCGKHDDAAMEKTVDLIVSMRPHLIVGYTQALALFARWIAERGHRGWGDLPVVCGAEAVLPGDRDAIARAFGPHVFETYGSREVMLMAAECEAHDGMHLAEENVVVEIVTEGRAASPGEPGDVVVTDLHNYGMPFIRYVNGDVATMSPRARCECGRGLRKLQHVEGRRVDTLRDAAGTPIPGLIFMWMMHGQEGVIRQYQLLQRRSGAVEMRVVRGRDWSEERFAKTTEQIAERLRGLPFQVIVVDAILPDRSGKRRPVMVEATEGT